MPARGATAHRLPDAERRTADDRQLREAAIALGRGHHFDEPHTLQVTGLALSLFDRLSTALGLDAADRRILHAAAHLLDIGIGVSDARHHKHSRFAQVFGRSVDFLPPGRTSP
jgi:exopolyphosphatase / guanosine-5'-triphosphate,3'-diphosphate pyrophosphatase